MTVDARGSGASFEEQLKVSSRTARRIGAARGLSPEEVDDFRSYVALKLIENDYARLRKFEGRSTFQTYIQVVVQRLFLDFCVQKHGKWHPSVRAKELGSVAVRLEQLVYREGFSFGEACWLVGRGGHEKREKLWDIYSKLPVRHRRRDVGIEQLEREGILNSIDSTMETERRQFGRELQKKLAQVLTNLERTDRDILKMRYRDQLSVGDIADHLGMGFSRTSCRLRRALRKLRVQLDAQGIRREEVREILDWPHNELDVDVLFRTGAPTEFSAHV